jgi:hypothetical protein
MNLEEQLKTILTTHTIKYDDALLSELLLACAKWQQVTLLTIHSQIVRRLQRVQQKLKINYLQKHTVA